MKNDNEKWLKDWKKLYLIYINYNCRPSGKYLLLTGYSLITMRVYCPVDL